MNSKNDRRTVLVLGAGFAGASTAWALGARGGFGGLILEREAEPGLFASGRNAGLARQVEHDPIGRVMAVRSLKRIRALDPEGKIFRVVGSLFLLHGGQVQMFGAVLPVLTAEGLHLDLLDRDAILARFPRLEGVAFDAALWCPDDGIVEVRPLLDRYLQEAARSGFELRTSCPAEEIEIDGEGRVRGVRTPEGFLAADVVVDATGAWAGRLGRPSAPLPLQPHRRHICVASGVDPLPAGHPYVWDLGASYYFRREGEGFMLSGCDESEHPAAPPEVDPSAEALLRTKLQEHAPGLAGLEIDRIWACLRTFAEDRHPVIGRDPEVEGLFHVGALGGGGMTTSAAVGELAAALIAGEEPDWIDLSRLAPSRLLR